MTNPHPFHCARVIAASMLWDLQGQPTASGFVLQDFSATDYATGFQQLAWWLAGRLAQTSGESLRTVLSTALAELAGLEHAMGEGGKSNG